MDNTKRNARARYEDVVHEMSIEELERVMNDETITAEFREAAEYEHSRLMSMLEGYEDDV